LRQLLRPFKVRLVLIRDLTFAAIDFESAGAMPGENDVPVQIGIALLEPGGNIDPAHFVRKYIRAHRPIAWSARKVHGITDEDIANAPEIVTLWPEISSMLGNRCVVAHSAGTEKRFLRAFPMHGFHPWIDTLKLAHAAWPDSKSHSLGKLTQSAGLVPELNQLCPGLRWHDALYDTVASLLILRHLIDTLDLHDAPLETLTNPDRSAYYAGRRIT
jgi:DNA polymerase-3 subunit epsilon